jgi:hypothetical protein
VSQTGQTSHKLFLGPTSMYKYTNSPGAQHLYTNRPLCTKQPRRPRSIYKHKCTNRPDAEHDYRIGRLSQTTFPIIFLLGYRIRVAHKHGQHGSGNLLIFLSLFKQTTVDETTTKKTSSLLLRTTSHTHTKLPAVLPAKTAPVILLSSLTQTLHMPSSFASSCS